MMGSQAHGYGRELAKKVGQEVGVDRKADRVRPLLGGSC